LRLHGNISPFYILPTMPGVSINRDVEISIPEGCPEETDDEGGANGGKIQELKSLFPWTLFTLLEYAENTNQEHIISWRPCGTCFKVHKRDAFMNKLLPEFGLMKMTKYKS
jgi:hypothetical protein